MPWTAISEPSLGLGILKARLARDGISSRVRHLNLFLLKYLKATTYFGIGEAFALNDFVFTRALQPEVSAEQVRALERRVDDLLANDARVWLGHEDRDRLRDLVLEVRDVAVPRFLDDCLAAIVSDTPSMVGFTCLFDQTIASVALGKMVKEARPETLIVLGGYALEGPVGRQVIASFPWVDAVANGEGEDVIARLARASLDRGALAGIPGVICRTEPWGAELQGSGTPTPRADLDRSPPPDYSDYQADAEQLEREHRVSVRWDTLPIESSRGCWWGEKTHCVFCGIDDDTMRYRFKDPEVVLQDMDTLAERHGLRQFRFSDYILPHAYYRTLLPRLTARAAGYVLSCEMKANVTLEKLRLMRDAGFVEVQPGIESFSTSVLRKMGKGVTAIQNVYTLLLGYRFDIEVHYNFLFGFPTDEAEDYYQQLRTIPLIYHLTPPISRNHVVTTRFAPMQTAPARFGVDGPIRHDHRYELIFSEEYAAACGFDYDQYCYYFERPYEISQHLEELYLMLRHQIQYWKDAHRTRDVRLSYERREDGVTFSDSRYGETPEERSLGPLHARVYEACADAIVSVRAIREATGLPESEVLRVVEDLAAERVLLREGSLCLGLAVPAAVYERTSGRDKSTKWVSPYV
jgi:ribosomal peptide maturation radical SAM protein 1